MKKYITLLAFLGIASISNATLNWNYTGSTLGTGYGEGWMVSMYKDVNTNTTLSSLIIYRDGTLSSADDVVAFQTSVIVDIEGSYFASGSLVTPGLFPAYSVVFNSTNFASATQYIILDDAVHAIPDADGINPASYIISSNSGTWKNIQAVPEPTTLLLFAIGGVGAWIVRRKQIIIM